MHFPLGKPSTPPLLAKVIDFMLFVIGPIIYEKYPVNVRYPDTNLQGIFFLSEIVKVVSELIFFFKKKKCRYTCYVCIDFGILNYLLYT